MAANVLNSPKAIEASVYVVRAFVRLRRMLATHKELARKLAELERRLDKHDESIVGLMTAIRSLMEPSAGKCERIGFKPPAKRRARKTTKTRSNAKTTRRSRNE